MAWHAVVRTAEDVPRIVERHIRDEDGWPALTEAFMQLCDGPDARESESGQLWLIMQALRQDSAYRLCVALLESYYMLHRSTRQIAVELRVSDATVRKMLAEAVGVVLARYQASFP